MVWNSNRITNPELPSLQHYWWWMDHDEWVPVMTNLPPALEAILQLVQFGCSKERCSTNPCQCCKAGLNCTDLCNCSDNGDTWDHDVQEEDVLYSDEEDSSDGEMYMPSEPHEQSITVFMTNKGAKTCFRKVMVDFDILVKLLWKVIPIILRWGKFIWSLVMVWLHCITVLKKKLGDDRLSQINVCRLQNTSLFWSNWLPAQYLSY